MPSELAQIVAVGAGSLRSYNARTGALLTIHSDLPYDPEVVYDYAIAGDLNSGQQPILIRKVSPGFTAAVPFAAYRFNRNSPGMTKIAS